LERAIRDALAVYYFPGMWDWPRSVVLPLVAKGLERSMTDQRALTEADEALDYAEQTSWHDAVATGQRLLEEYTTWAATADCFAPVLVEAEFSAQVPHPTIPGASLATAEGGGVVYTGRVDALVVDEHDAYWILRHRLVPRPTPVSQLRLDGASSAACWAWANFYLGMTVAGTIDNELLQGEGDASPDLLTRRPAGRRVAQHEPSGGGRSIPQHRRMSARATEPESPPPVEEEWGPGFRRVWIRRSPSEVEQSGRRLAEELSLIVDERVLVYPSPSAELCSRCPYLGPCLEVNDGRDANDGALAADFREKAASESRAGRIGSTTWGTGRGAAPPRF
jgi:hypothetical protein